MPWPPGDVDLNDLPRLVRASLAVRAGQLSWRGDPLVRLTLIEKTREEWRVGPLAIMIDDVVGLGRCIECEANTEDGAAFLSTLVAQYRLDHIPVGYVEMMLRRTRPSLYQLGKYVLTSDLAR